MKSLLRTCAVAAMSFGLASFGAYAQVAGTQPIGVTVEVTHAILKGWSVKNSILNQPVFNEKNEKVGTVRDIIVAPDRSVSFAIVSADAFLGVTHHDVAIPVEQLDFAKGKLMLPGATRDAIKAMPEFEYAKMVSNPMPRKDFNQQ